MLQGVRRGLRAIECHLARARQASLSVKREFLHERSLERLQMRLSEVADEAEVRPFHAGHGHEVHALLADRRDAPCGVDALAVRVQQQRRHPMSYGLAVGSGAACLRHCKRGWHDEAATWLGDSTGGTLAASQPNK